MALAGAAVAAPPDYRGPFQRAGQGDDLWRTGLIGVLLYRVNSPDQAVTRIFAEPDQQAELLASCDAIELCPFDGTVVWGELPQRRLRPHERTHRLGVIELPVRQRRGDWFEVVYQVGSGSLGWVHEPDTFDPDPESRYWQRVSFLSLEQRLTEAMLVRLIGGSGRDRFARAQLMGRPQADAQHVAPIDSSMSFLVLEAPRLRGDWLRVQHQGDDCWPSESRLIVESFEKLPWQRDKDCAWGWLRWRDAQGRLLVWWDWEALF